VKRWGAALLLGLVVGACASGGSAAPAADPPPLPELAPATTANPAAEAEGTTSEVPSSAATAATVPWASLAFDEEKTTDIPEPVEISIDTVGIEARVVALGVDEGGAMEVPDDIGEVGWYQFGPIPGAPGSSVLAAHVDKAGEGPGVFFYLDEVRAGDLISIKYADGTIAPFRVVSAERVAKGDLAVDSIFASSGEPLLRLITCGGSFNESVGSYDDNVVVTALPEAP